jgi:hypothetical protein
LLTASGSGFLWPKAYLNTTQTLVSAEEMTVVAATSDGTSLTFHDPIESPGISGSVWFGVENRNDSNVGWRAVTVTATTADVTANGAATIPLLTASGTGSISFLTPDVYVTGGPANVDLPIVTTAGEGVGAPVHGDGAATLPLITASGTSAVTRHANGSPSIPLITASGETFPPHGNGAVVLPLLTASGTGHAGEIPIRDTHFASVLIVKNDFQTTFIQPLGIYSSVQVQDETYATAPIGGDSFAVVRIQND